MMNQIRLPFSQWAAIAVLIILILVIQPVSGIVVSRFTLIGVDPSGALNPDMPVTLSCIIDIYGNENATERIRFDTDLSVPRWNYTIHPDTKLRSSPGKTLILHGDDPSQTGPTNTSILLTLSGRAPPTDRTGDLTILQVGKLDQAGNPEYPVIFRQTAILIATGGNDPVQDPHANLRTLQSHIEQQKVLGVNTSAAEAEYNEAKRLSDALDVLPPDNYTAVSMNLNAELTAIYRSEQALDRARAEKTVAEARARIDQADRVIAWFRSNQSTRDDTILSSIVARREVAMHYLSIAEEEIANGYYEQARTDSRNASVMANESYHDALNRQSQITGPSLRFCGNPQLSFDRIFVIILICLLPAFLTAGLYSLMKSLSAPWINSILRPVGPVSVYVVFVGSWIVYLILLMGAGLLRGQSFHEAAIIVSVIWAGLITIVMILSLIISGKKVLTLIRGRMKKEIPESNHEDVAETVFATNKMTIKISLMILLIILMPLVILCGLFIAFPFPCI